MCESRESALPKHIVVWLLNGGSRVAYSKISAADVIHSVIPEQSGRMCGKLQTIYMQPLKCTKHISTPTTGCTCIAAKVELMLWMGLYRQMGAFESYLPHGHKLGIKEYDIYMKSTRTLVLEFRVYVYKAKLNISADYSVPQNPFVRVNILNSVEDTITIQKTASPVWNQMLKICKMVNTTPERLSADPPYVLVEVYDSDLSNNTELIGRFQIQPVIGDTQSYEYAPKLQWYDIYKGETQTGQLLMSMQLIQIPETLLKTTVYSTEEETYYVSAGKDTDMSCDNIQRLPSSILPRSNKYKLDVYWWGLRDLKITKKPYVIIELDDLTVKSETINDKRNNCNFPNCLVSQIFETALYESHCPPMTIRLYDSSTFGRTVFLGTKVVRDPKKYLIDCIPKSVRDISLRSKCIMSADFCQVTQMLCVKKTQSLKSADSISVKSEKPYSATKKSKWRRLLKKSLDEEEYALLPVPMKGRELDMRGKFDADLIDWWYMFNASQKIYNEELELQAEFSRFKDWCYTVKLYKGKKTGLPENDEKLHCGFLKVGIAIYEWPPPDDVIAVGANGVELNKGYFSDYPANETKKFLIRVYMIKGISLVAKDFTGKCDPYVVISCGDKHLGDRSEYIANSTNPVFGKMYEFRCTLPDDYLFTVSLYDYDSEDELIGSTIIDIENRVYSRHRARVGLPYKYKTAGPNKWHDILKPSEILEDLCLKNHLQLPQYPDLNTVILNGVEYKDNDRPSLSYTSNDRKEDICLSLLQNWHTMPVCGHYLVPEHVETRSLFNPDKPGIEQGKVQMWVDIFPMDVYTFIPSPVDITPRKEQDYELRVIVWDVLNLKMDRKEDGKADLYVKAWIGSIDDAQYTDVHYRTEMGNSSFNWRMIFQFQYKPTERKLIRKEKGPFTEVEEHWEPVFTAHVLDSEIELTLQDDVTASLVLNLNSMSRGFKNASQCDLKVMMNSKKINLFKVRSVKAWWPLKCTNRNTGYSSNAGSIELELMLLPAEKAVLMPVGLGREPPAPLPFPDRQPSSRSSKMRLLENICRYGGIEVLIGIFITALLVTAIFYWKLPTLVYELLVEE
ncbi:hypothetical protein K1T71_000391 [Dendrolimus kikuchii]|uniref:Uncharacterized protein n=1 Tax=Dendrolimus kikuchii TaxID=765133 RepID=A0ACC1DJ40_9NEOP|nr:hypothetical protein K1T71_000391 [Dendrolimus kikuchii]